MVISVRSMTRTGTSARYSLWMTVVSAALQMEQDAQSLGLTSIGTIKLQKSGKCELDLLGEKSEGTWKQAKDGKIEIQYGDDLKLTGSVDDEGIMTLQDPQGAEYKLKK